MNNILLTMSTAHLLTHVKVCRTKEAISKVKVLADYELVNADNETKEHVMKCISYTEDLINNPGSQPRNITINEAMQKSQELLNSTSLLLPDQQKQRDDALRNAKLFGEHYLKATNHFDKNSR